MVLSILLGHIPQMRSPGITSTEPFWTKKGCGIRTLEGCMPITSSVFTGMKKSLLPSAWKSAGSL